MKKRGASPAPLVIHYKAPCAFCWMVGLIARICIAHHTQSRRPANHETPFQSLLLQDGASFLRLFSAQRCKGVLGRHRWFL